MGFIILLLLAGIIGGGLYLVAGIWLALNSEPGHRAVARLLMLADRWGHAPDWLIFAIGVLGLLVWPVFLVIG